MSRITIILLGAALAATACATAPPPPVPEIAPVLVAASAEGVVVLDTAAESFFGLTRTGRQVWQDRAAFHSGAVPVCLARCPDAVFSGAWTGPDPRPWHATPAGPRPFAAAPSTTAPSTSAPSTSSVRRVLSARTSRDAVIAEGPAGGAGRLRLIRPDGEPAGVPVDDAAEVVWSEDPGGTTALAVAGDEVLWFRHDRRGWRRLPGGLRAGRTWGACTAAGGERAVLVGDAPRLLSGRGRAVPIRTDLEVAAECAAGRGSAVLIARWKDERGTPFTAVRGVDGTGAQTWAREVRAEAHVRADPVRDRFVIAHGGGAELVDGGGRTLKTYPGVSSAAYTGDGQLVLLRADRGLHWPAP
ncbi:hypothetical protein [Nonomuraea sp. LPB2021202275-12-8]|uniref:hypothetical protein n=1 Tax=Nonomuraea sp. LPB2021202275-12-8 TaxID=3120159 RepID=UPI00300C4C4A